MVVTIDDEPSDIEFGIHVDGTKEWFRFRKLHREDGPAVERPDGTREWWIDGSRHRADGPAIGWADGSSEWWLNGKQRLMPLSSVRSPSP